MPVQLDVDVIAAVRSKVVDVPAFAVTVDAEVMAAVLPRVIVRAAVTVESD